jgi:hypothetical protein
VLAPIILATQEAEISRIGVLSQSWDKLFKRLYLEKTNKTKQNKTKKGLLEWLKV